MKIKKLIIVTVFLAVCAAAICLGGCSQKHTITINAVSGGSVVNSYALTVAQGEEVSFGALKEAYPDEFESDSGLWTDSFFFTDEECLTKYVEEGATQDIALYYGIYNPASTWRITFVYGGESYVIYRAAGATLSAQDFSRSAYGYGAAEDYAFYSDGAHTVSVSMGDISAEDLTGNEVTLYVADAD